MIIGRFSPFAQESTTFYAIFTRNSQNIKHFLRKKFKMELIIEFTDSILTIDGCFFAYIFKMKPK